MLAMVDSWMRVPVCCSEGYVQQPIRPSSLTAYYHVVSWCQLSSLFALERDRHIFSSKYPESNISNLWLSVNCWLSSNAWQLVLYR
jgi:hypothetical protein